MTKIKVIGKTYGIKDDLKKLGFSWNRDEKQWEGLKEEIDWSAYAKRCRHTWGSESRVWRALEFENIAEETEQEETMYEMVNDSYGNVPGETDTAENWIIELESLCKDQGWDAPQLRKLSDGTYVDADGEVVLVPVD